MQLYGICVSDIKNFNSEKANQFIQRITSEHSDIEKIAAISESYHKYIESGKTVEDFLYDYENGDQAFGLSAFLVDVITAIENVNITSDDTDGIHYLGLKADAPWNMNAKTRNISCANYDLMLRNYIAYFTDDIIDEPKWHCPRQDAE